RHAEVYVSGTQPVGTCPLHGGGRLVTNVTGWEVAPPPPAQPTQPADTAPRVTGSNGDGLVPPSSAARRAARQDPPHTPPAAQTENNPPEPPKKEEKKGIF